MATQNASPKIAGYVFQFERALYRLFSSEAQGTIVGIETDDDVVEVTRDAGGDVHIVFEQDKLTLQADKQPYQDSSKNLWHTLHIWLEALHGAKQKSLNIKYCLVTNTSVPEQAFARSLSSANDDHAINICMREIRQHAKRSSGEVASTVKAVANFSDNDLRFLIQNIVLLDEDGTTSGETPKNATIQLFQLSSDLAVKAEDIYRSILGFVVDTCQRNWLEKQPVWISKDVVAKLLHAEIAAHRMARYVDQPLMSTSFKDYLKTDDKSHFFLQQLQYIGSSTAACDRALSHYWGFYSERIRLQNEGDVLPTAWEERNAQLHERWEVLCDKVELTNGKDGKEEVAKKIFAATIDGNYMARLGLYETQNPYFTYGNYHDLANQPKHKFFVHWHGDFALKKDGGE